MKVKVGDKVYDSNHEPIVLIFEDEKDRLNHSKSLSKPGSWKKYCLVPTNLKLTEKELKELLSTEKEGIAAIGIPIGPKNY